MADSDISVLDLTPEQHSLLQKVMEELPLAALIPVLSEEIWVREVLKDVSSRIPGVRTKALEMWGKHLGLLQAKVGKSAGRKEVEFSE